MQLSAVFMFRKCQKHFDLSKVVLEGTRKPRNPSQKLNDAPATAEITGAFLLVWNFCPGFLPQWNHTPLGPRETG